MRIQSLCKWPDDKLAELGNEYNNGLSFGQLAKKYDCSLSTISSSIKRIGIKTRMISHDINSNYFEFLNSADKCYWLGFLAADGYAKRKSRQYHLVINLKAADVRHLHKFKDAIGATHPIRIRSYISPFGCFNHARFEISCKKMVEDLNRHGLYRFKDDEEMPNIDANLMNHFLRGYLDGDGTVHFSLIGREGRWPRALVGYVGDRKILESISQVLFSVCGAHLNKIRFMNNICYINWSGCRQSLKILRWLYKDSTENIRLDRKYQTYLRMEEWSNGRIA